MFLDMRVRVIDDNSEIVFGPGLVTLLEHIKSSDSMKEACSNMGISYSKGWKIINRAEKCLGYDLILRQHGGSKGGKCNVTQEGESLIKRYKSMMEVIKKESDNIFLDTFPEYKDENN